VVLEYHKELLDLFEEVLREHTGKEVSLAQDHALNGYLLGAFSKVLVRESTDDTSIDALFVGRIQSSSSGRTLHLSRVTPGGMRFYQELREHWIKEMNIVLLERQVKVGETQQWFAETQNKIMDKQRILIRNTLWVYFFIALIYVVQLIVGFIRDRTVISPTSTLAYLGLIIVVVILLMFSYNTLLAQQEDTSATWKEGFTIFTVVVSVVLLLLFVLLACAIHPSLGALEWKTGSGAPALVITPNVTVTPNITVLVAPKSVANQSPS
jgi:hypothetical protein